MEPTDRQRPTPRDPLGIHLERVRRQARKSQQQLAHELGWTIKRVRAIERNGCHRDVAEQIVSTLGLTSDVLSDEAISDAAQAHEREEAAERAALDSAAEDRRARYQARVVEHSERVAEIRRGITDETPPSKSHQSPAPASHAQTPAASDTCPK